MLLTNYFQINLISLNKLVFLYLKIRCLVDGMEEDFVKPTAWYII